MTLYVSSGPDSIGRQRNDWEGQPMLARFDPWFWVSPWRAANLTEIRLQRHAAGVSEGRDGTGCLPGRPTLGRVSWAGTWQTDAEAEAEAEARQQQQREGARDREANHKPWPTACCVRGQGMALEPWDTGPSPVVVRARRARRRLEHFMSACCAPAWDDLGDLSRLSVGHMYAVGSGCVRASERFLAVGYQASQEAS